MSVPMSLEYSVDALQEFLQYMADKGLANKNTISSRKAAVSKMFEILESGEAADVRDIDMDNLAHRFNNLRGTNYSPESLQVYKSRASKALQDFIRFKENPSGFKPATKSTKAAVASRAPKKPRGEARQSVPLADPSSYRGAEEPRIIASTPLIDVPVALRPDLVIYIKGLPTDLSESEAEKISAVVKAMGSG